MNSTNPLAVVIVVKILVTIGWIFGCLIAPIGLLTAMGFAVQEPAVFLRLLGVAHVALVLGYALGLRDTLQGKRIAVTVAVGIVSDGGAFLALLLFSGAWSTWPQPAAYILWASTVSVLIITGGLLVLGRRDLAAI